MYEIKLPALLRLCLVLLLALSPCAITAADSPLRAAETADLAGTWRQVGVVVLDAGTDADDPWFQAKQFFRFPADGGFRHVLVNPDSEPGRTAPTEIQRVMLEEGPSVQTLKWHSKGIGFLKHPERPQQRVDFGLYLRDAPSGPSGGAIEPRKGDLILVFYTYKEVNTAWYYRLLRKQP